MANDVSYFNLENDSTEYAFNDADAEVKIAQETARATAAEGANAAAISAETTRATGVEGTLSDLTTTAKSNLVAAINEIDAKNSNGMPSGMSGSNTAAEMVNAAVAGTIYNWASYDDSGYRPSGETGGYWHYLLIKNASNGYTLFEASKVNAGYFYRYDVYHDTWAKFARSDWVDITSSVRSSDTNNVEITQAIQCGNLVRLKIGAKNLASGWNTSIATISGITPVMSAYSTAYHNTSSNFGIMSYGQLGVNGAVSINTTGAIAGNAQYEFLISV